MKAVAATTRQGIIYAIASYGMTFFRLGIAFFIGVSFLVKVSDVKLIAVAGTLFIVGFDYYDGELFKKSFLINSKKWRVNRRILDSVVDRLVIHVICLSVLIVDSHFLPFYLPIILREVVLSTYLSIKFKQGLLIYPGPIAKLACAFVGFNGIAYLITSSLTTICFTVSMMCMSVLAFREYFKISKGYKEGRIEASLNAGIEEI